MAKEAETKRNSRKAVAYFRTSSASNVGEDKDSLRRQQEAVRTYAKRRGVEIVAEYYDAAVSGGDPINERPGFGDLLGRIAGNGVGVVLVEDASRFARDLAVQLTGHEMLKRIGVDLVPVNAPDFFTDETPTAVMVRQILGAVSQFEKTQLVLKLKAARQRKKAKGEHAEGRPPVPAEVVTLAKKLARARPKAGKRSLREIADELAKAGYLSPSAKPYGAESVKQMLAR